MTDSEYFNWAYQGLEEAHSKELSNKKDNKTKCPEMGCTNGFIILFTSREECPTCNRSGKAKKQKGK